MSTSNSNSGKVIPPKIVSCWVNKDECLSHTLCELEAPDILRMDEEDTYPEFCVTDEAILNEKRDQILNASSVCPVNAIMVLFESGEILNQDSKKFEEYLSDEKET